MKNQTNNLEKGKRRETLNNREPHEHISNISQNDKKVNSFVKISQISSKNSLELPRPFKNNKEYHKYLMKEAATFYGTASLSNEGKVSVDSEFFVSYLMHVVKIKCLATPNELGDTTYEYYIRDYDNKYLLWRPANIKMLIMIACELKQVSVANLDKTYRDVLDRLQNKHTIIEDESNKLNLPPSNFILTENGLFDSDTFTITTDIDFIEQYHFINVLPFKILPTSLVDKAHLEIVKRVMKDWSDNDDEKLTYLKQLGIAAMDGNGRKAYNLIIGSGGNGKSTFLNILTRLASEKYTKRLNLPDLSDDNKIGDITPATKLIVGHDLATHAKLSKTLTSRFKEFVLEEPFAVNVKYKPTKNIASKGLKIQATNTLMDIFENTDAMRRRLRLLEWTNTNFSKLNDSQAFDLDALVGSASSHNYSQPFYEAFIAFCYDEMQPFKRFIEIQSVVDATNEMINESDSIYHFTEYLKDSEFTDFEILPTDLMYQLYLIWHNTENPGGKSMKRQTMMKRLSVFMRDIGFVTAEVPRRPYSMGKLKFNIDIINQQLPKKQQLYINTSKKCRYYINPNNEISEQEIDNVKYKLENNLYTDKYDIPTKELLIIYYLKDESHPEATELVFEIEDN